MIVKFIKRIILIYTGCVVVLKKNKGFRVLSIVFTLSALVCFTLALLDFIYIVNLEKELVSVLIGLYLFFVLFVLLLLAVAFGISGGVFSLIALKKQIAKILHIITLTISSVLVTVCAGLILYMLISACFG